MENQSDRKGARWRLWRQRARQRQEKWHARLEPYRRGLRQRLNEFLEKAHDRDAAAARCLRPYHRAVGERLQQLRIRAQAWDAAAGSFLKPYRQRLGATYQRLLRDWPVLDRTTGRLRVVGTLIWAHLATLGRYLRANWPAGWIPRWPPRQALDWLSAGALVTVFVVGANFTSGQLPTLPAPPRAWEVIAYYENDQGGFFVSSLPALTEYSHLIDTVSPYWYSLDAQGAVAFARHDPAAVRQARAGGQRLVPLVTYLTRGQEQGDAFLNSADQRHRTVVDLVQLVDQRGYDGLNLYFPWLAPESREDFTALVGALGQALRGRNKLLGISVYPREAAPPQLHAGFDYARLGQLADYVILMAYDYHWEQTEPGPVAPLSWVRANVRSALQDIPGEKLVLGIGMFGYDWAQGDIPTQHLPSYAARSRAENQEVVLQRAGASGQPHYAYQSRGIRHQVWFEDAISLEAKLALVEEHQLRGIALWRLGFAEPAVWQLIGDHLGAR